MNETIEASLIAACLTCIICAILGQIIICCISFHGKKREKKIMIEP